MSLAAAASGTYYDQVIEPKRRLSYIPQCEGSEERLRNCSTLSHDGNCAAPVAISCWNNSAIATSPTVAPSFTSSSSRVSSTVPNSSLQESCRTYFQQIEPSSCLPTHTLSITDSTISTRRDVCWQWLVYGILVGTVVGVGITGTLSIALYLIHRKINQRIFGLNYITGGGDDMERNPAYQTSTSIIPPSSNPAYAGLNTHPMQSNSIPVYEDVSL